MKMSELYHALKQMFPDRVVSVKFEITTWQSGNQETECTLYISPIDETGRSITLSSGTFDGLKLELDAYIQERNLNGIKMLQDILDEEVETLTKEAKDEKTVPDQPGRDG